jgi:uncharacterized protein YjbJ (UPF0337 family)
MDLRLRGNWNLLKGKLKEKYGQLTDDDLSYIEGKEEQLIGILQNKLHKKREEVVRELENLLGAK